MALGYRAVFRLDDSEDAVRIASEQMRSWLHSKREGTKYGHLRSWDWDGAGVHVLGDGAELTVVNHEGEDGGHRQLLELVENQEGATWTTRVYAASLPSARRLRQTLWVETGGSGGRADTTPPAPPRIVRNILDAVNARDGEVPILSKPEVIDTANVDRLIGYIDDEFRDLSIVVAAPVGGVPDALWAKAISGLVKESLGVTSAFVLTESAYAHFEDQIGGTHRVPAGSVRTYLPGVIQGDRADALRHRILGARTMARSLGPNQRFSQRITQVHSTTARQRIIETPLPPELLRVERILNREKLQLVRGSEMAAFRGRALDEQQRAKIASTPIELSKVRATSMAKPVFEGLSRLVARWTSRGQVDAESIDELDVRFSELEGAREVSERQISELFDTATDLEERIKRLRVELDNERLDHEIAEEEKREANRKVIHLSAELKGLQAFDSVVIPPAAEWESPPESVADLILRLTIGAEEFDEVTRYVELTGDADKALERAEYIDQRDGFGQYSGAFWEHVLVLRAYAIARLERDFSGGVHQYLTDDSVDGLKCSPQRHKATESETVGNDKKMRGERTFPVPVRVDPAGEVYMAAHFAPTHRDTTAPRLHYHDDIPRTRKVYVGYIGRHLRNTKTN